MCLISYLFHIYSGKLQGKVEGTVGFIYEAPEKTPSAKWVWGNKPEGLEIYKSHVLSGTIYARRKVSPLREAISGLA